MPTYSPFHAGERTYPELPLRLKDELARIEPALDGVTEYFPCCVQLDDGTSVDRVYVAAAQRYIDTWGVWPDQDRGKREVRIERVLHIRPSLARLPVRFANQLYRAGESGMGYVVFTAKFGNGTSRAYVLGNAVDFITVPPGLTVEDIVEVMPHVGREGAQASEPPYYWCLHGTGRARTASLRFTEDA
jgi:hypothetical protein